MRIASLSGALAAVVLAALSGCAFLAGLTELRRAACEPDCGADAADVDELRRPEPFRCVDEPCADASVCCLERLPGNAERTCRDTCVGIAAACLDDEHCGDGLSCCGQPDLDGGVALLVCAAPGKACPLPPCAPDGGCAEPHQRCTALGDGLPRLCL